MILLPGLKIGYQNVPKIATTSLFFWLYQCMSRFDPATAAPIQGSTGNYLQVRQYFLSGGAGVVVHRNNKRLISRFDECFRFAVTRDPVRRFLSMYSNRVLHHRELSATARCAEALRTAGLPFDPPINELVERLEEYLSVAGSINHHSRPMLDFLGPNLGVYEQLIDISAIDTLIAHIAGFWKQQGILERIGELPMLERRQTGGPKLDLDVLSADSFAKLLRFYHRDYERLPSIDRESITAQYAAACSDALNRPPDAVIPVRAATTTLREPYPAAGQKLKHPRAGRLHARKHRDQRIESLQLRAADKKSAAGSRLTLKGTVLARIDARELQLIVVDANGEHRVEWGLASPRLAQKYPHNPQAASARVDTGELQLAAGASVCLYLQAADGSRSLLYEIAPTRPASIPERKHGDAA